MTVLGVDAWGAGDLRPVAPGAAGVVEELAAAPDGDVLVVAGGADALRAARIAISALARPGVALLEVTGPATRRHALRLALELLPAAGFGYADAVVGAVGSTLRTRALLSSVARLTEPNPGLVDHVAGWLPGQWFVVDVDDAAVRRTPQPLLELPAGPLAVRAEQWTRADPAVTEPVAGTEVRLTGPDRSASWRCAQWVEVTVATAPLAQTVQAALDDARARACASCGRPVTGDRCRPCGIVVPAGSGAAAGRSMPPTGPPSVPPTGPPTGPPTAPPTVPGAVPVPLEAPA